MKKTINLRKKTLDVIKWIWFIAVIIGAGYYFKRNFKDISVYLETISYSRVALSILTVFVGKFVLSYLTQVSLRKIDYEISYKESLTITSITQLGKYLPGGIWHVAGKFGMYKAHKISTKNTTLAIVFETYGFYPRLWLLGSFFSYYQAVMFYVNSKPFYAIP